MRIPLLAAAAMLIGLPALAEPLGITAAEFRLGASHPDTSREQALGPVATDSAPDLFLGVAAVNVAITEAHGLQLDATLEDAPGGAVGRLGAHLFMTPQDAHKYGLFATLSDLDDTEATWGSLGIEGILALSPRASAELRGGIGYGTAGLDWIFASAALAREIGAGTVRAAIDVTEFDEIGLSAIATETRLGVEAPLTPRLAAFGDVVYARLDGANVAPETILRGGFTLRFGTLGGVSPRTQLFATPDPVALLARRGWF